MMTAATITIGLLGTSAGLTAMWWHPPAAPETRAEDVPHLPIVVAAETFRIAPGAIRVEAQRHPGPQDRVDLVYAWPDLTPAATTPVRTLASASATVTPEITTTETTAAGADRLYVTIAPAAGTVELSERLKTVYRRYLEPIGQARTDGLEVIAFRESSPYRGEDMAFDKAAPARFHARCTRTVDARASGSCLAERRVGSALVTFRFPRERLDEWPALSAAFDRLIATLRHRRAG